jgi:hypothetical protein
LKWTGIILCLTMSLTNSCGIDTSGDHDVSVRDSKQTITVRTTLDKILEICGIVLADGTVIPYNKWTEEHRECLEKLDNKGILDDIKDSET